MYTAEGAYIYYLPGFNITIQFLSLCEHDDPKEKEKKKKMERQDNKLLNRNLEA
jgi:hypothetical protein